MWSELYKTVLGIIQTNPNGSSKRIIIVLSYLSAIALSWYALVSKHVIDTNELILVLSLAGLSTGNYAVTVKNENKTTSV